MLILPLFYGMKEPPHREFAQLTIPELELVTVNDGMYTDGYEWYALVTDLDLSPRAISQLYRDCGDCENIFDEAKRGQSPRKVRFYWGR